MLLGNTCDVCDYNIFDTCSKVESVNASNLEGGYRSSMCEFAKENTCEYVKAEYWKTEK